MSKQDRQGVRTATDLERKYQFGKTFAEVIGIAEAAREAAEESKESYENLDHDEIFNLLTKNGELQGLYRGDDGQLYINASYIAAGLLKSLNGVTTLNLSTGDLLCKDNRLTYYVKVGDGGIELGETNEEHPVMTIQNYGPGGGIGFYDYSTGNVVMAMMGLSDTVIMAMGDGKTLAIQGSVTINGGTFPEYVEGVEYQLPEKYNGKTVYTQMVSFGQMPRSGYAWKAMTDIDATKVISLEGRCFNTTEVNEFPVYLGGSLGAYCWFDISGIGVNAVQNMSEFSAEFIIKYYKD